MTTRLAKIIAFLALIYTVLAQQLVSDSNEVTTGESIVEN